MAVLSYQECRRLAGLSHEQVGIEMWFKASRPRLTEHDRAAMCWWLERKAGRPVDEPQYILSRPDHDSLNDPLAVRTYYGDGSWHWGHRPGEGQHRVGGGVKGWV